MSESSITPLARRLAEENNVDWVKLQGSGPDGWVVEKDVLEYLARVMEGSEALDPTEEPLPEGLASWDDTGAPPDPEAWQTEPVAEREPEAAPVQSDDEFELEGLEPVEAPIEAELLEAELVAREPVEAGLGEAGLTETEPADFELDEGIFLFDEEVAEPAVTPGAPAGLSTLGTDDDFLLPDGLLDGEAGLLADDLLDDDYLEDDFLTDLATEDGELDSPEAADADLHGYGMFSGQKAHTGEIDLLTDDVDLFALETDSPISGQGTEFGADALGSAPFEDAWDEGQDGVEFTGTGWTENEPVLAQRSLQDHLKDDAARAASEPDGFEVDFSEIGADDAARLAAAEVEAWESEPDFEPESAALLEPDFELESEPESDFAPEPDFTLATEPEPALGVEALPDDTPATAVAVAPLPAGLPLVSHGTLLRRHVDVTQLGQVQLAVGLELGQEEQLDALPFLLRAAQRSGPLEGSEGSEVAAAVLSEAGVRIMRPDGAAAGSFGELARYLLDDEQAAGVDDFGAGVSVIACDMSALQVDEAVLHLGSPVLALGRVLFDSEQGTYHSTLTLSGTFSPAAGAQFLQDVGELLASPVRLLI